MYIESWIVNDEFFDACCWGMPKERPFGLAKLITPFVLKELNMENNKKHEKAKGVAVIRKTVADIASEYDLENLIQHEAAHLWLGHEAAIGDEHLDWETQERQVRELIGDAEIANDLFSTRYLMIYGLNWKGERVR